jgi:uncharacterized caspase-like protein
MPGLPRLGQFAGRVEGADVAIVYFAGHGSTSTARLGKVMASETEKWAKAIRFAGISIN